MAVVGYFVFAEQLPPLKVASIGLIVLGVVGLMRIVSQQHCCVQYENAILILLMHHETPRTENVSVVCCVNPQACG